jgi:hypothetical protein
MQTWGWFILAVFSFTIGEHVQLPGSKIGISPYTGSIKSHKFPYTSLKTATLP